MGIIFKAIINGYLKGGTFSRDVASMGPNMVEATVAVYQEIMKELKPTPTKSHYQFNLRDVSKVFQGILMGNPSGNNDPETMAKLWIHETMRVFHDRLINNDD